MQKKERKNAGVSLLMERIYLSNLCAGNAGTGKMRSGRSIFVWPRTTHH